MPATQTGGKPLLMKKSSRIAVVPKPVDADHASRQAPLYAFISELLRKAIHEGKIENGAVLLEGHVAEILKSTRTPVRQALHALEEEGLVSRFEGRGFIAGAPGTEPRRITLDAAMLSFEPTGEPFRKTMGWESIYDIVERDVVHLSVFDSFRINEVELARHFEVGRMVARDVLLRLESLGLLEKDERLRWVIKPLDAVRINHLYELRWLLEPAALRSAMLNSTSVDSQELMRNLKTAMRVYPVITRTDLDNLENDLHVKYLSRCTNKELLQSLQRTRCLLTLSKHVLGVSAPMPKRDPFMAEHLSIFKSIAEGDTLKAENCLRSHLEESSLKVAQRASVVREHFPRPDLPYLG